jgi:hypothetical protein
MKQYPIASNIFGGDFRSNFDSADFVLSSIFKSDISAQQTTILKYALQALAVIPDATVSTLMDLMEDGSYQRYQHCFEALDPVVHRWIRDKLHHKDFSVSRVAIKNRLDGFLADPFFRAMFAEPQSKLDLFEELQSPKVYLR